MADVNAKVLGIPQPMLQRALDIISQQVRAGLLRASNIAGLTVVEEYEFIQAATQEVCGALFEQQAAWALAFVGVAQLHPDAHDANRRSVLDEVRDDG